MAKITPDPGAPEKQIFIDLEGDDWIECIHSKLTFKDEVGGFDCKVLGTREGSVQGSYLSIRAQVSNISDEIRQIDQFDPSSTRFEIFGNTVNIYPTSKTARCMLTKDSDFGPYFGDGLTC